MCNYNRRRKKSATFVFSFFIAIFPLILPSKVFSQRDSLSDISISGSKVSFSRFTHQIGISFGHAFIIPSAPFFEGQSYTGKPLHNALSGHIKYSFGLPAGTVESKIFANTYQGIGLGYYNFESSKDLGSPVLVYLFQRSRIAELGSKASIDYEWNFGISAGWNPYDRDKNPGNVFTGSKLNAYINAGAYVNWAAGQRLLLMGGIDFTHFSNGNTKFPNAGLNAAGIKLGAIYDVSSRRDNVDYPPADMVIVPKFQRHVSYDWVIFGAWRRKGVDFLGKQIASPYKYAVAGTYFAPMYNFGYRFRAGLSLDAIYDGSANVYTEDYIIGTEQKFFKPGFDRQIALGLSARGEYVMPIFIISIGIGRNIIHKGGDLGGFYQSLALKIKTTRSSFLHIGYNLKDFHEPNYLMLGLGYRFNSKTLY